MVSNNYSEIPLSSLHLISIVGFAASLTLQCLRCTEQSFMLLPQEEKKTGNGKSLATSVILATVFLLRLLLFTQRLISLYGKYQRTYMCYSYYPTRKRIQETRNLLLHVADRCPAVCVARSCPELTPGKCFEENVAREFTRFS